MRTILTYEKLLILLSKMDDITRRKLAKQMVVDNDYLFILDSNVINSMINTCSDDVLIELFREFDRIGILDEYCIENNSKSFNIVRSNGLNTIYNINNNIDEYSNMERDTFYMKYIAILIPVLCTILCAMLLYIIL